MIEIIIFAGVMFALGFGFAKLDDSVQAARQTITCRCGASFARNVIIVESADRQRLIDLLTENCGVCRSNRSIPNPQPPTPNRKGLLMLRVELYECHRCGGLIPRENCAVVRHADHVDRYFYCDFCRIGWEVAEYPDGDVLALDFHERTEPLNFQRFLDRLRDARAA